MCYTVWRRTLQYCEFLLWFTATVLRRTQLGCSFHCSFFHSEQCALGIMYYTVYTLFGEFGTLRVLLIVKLRARAPCRRTQHCWPTNPNNTGCYTLRLFAHLFHVGGSLCTKFETDKPFSSRANGRKIPKMLGVLASIVESVARGFTSR